MVSMSLMQLQIVAVNRKTSSIVLLALVDVHYKFIAVDIGSNEKNSNGGIFSNSKMGKALERKKLNVPEEKHFPELVKAYHTK
jgi:hypothetical protein